MKKISDFDVYGVNPINILSNDLRVVSRIKKGGIKYLQNLETGEQMNMQELGTSFTTTTDTREYRKLYVEGLSSIANLSSAGLRVWCYVLTRLEAKKDYVDINVQDIMEYTGYKNSSNVYNGIINLLENRLLFRKGLNSYYININVYFNGKRKYE